jgi:hypothetical protein
MLLCELFDRPYTFTWDERWSPQEISARAQTQAGALKVAFLRFYSEDVITVEFSLGDGFELTGRGDEIAIFATVKQAIAEYLKRYGRPRFLLFTSKGEKRTRTYGQLIRRYAAGMGYKTTTAHALPEIVQKNLGDFMPHDDYFVLQDTHSVDENEPVTELFEPRTAYRLTWDERYAPTEIEARAQISQGRKMNITFHRLLRAEPRVLDIYFDVDHSFNVTGRGDQFRIFNTVIAAIRHYVEHYDRPQIITFLSKGASRIKLYQRLIREIAPALGYKIMDPKLLPGHVKDALGQEMTRADHLFALMDTHAELDEGWREKTAAAMAAATLGYGALDQAKTPAPQAPQAQIVQPQKATPQTQKSAPQASIDDKIEASVPEQHREVVSQARAAGIHGDELAHFMSQVKKEVGGTWSLTELPPPDSKNPRAYFMRKYDFKKTLGNTKKGDGWLFRGGGYLHLTGRDNYTRCSKALYGDDRLVVNPDIVRTDQDAAIKTAIWYWQNRVATHVSDFSKASVGQVTKRVNKGQKGLKQRQAYYQQLAQR